MTGGLIDFDSLAVVLAEPLELLELDGVVEIEFEILAVLDWLAETDWDFENSGVRVCRAVRELVGEFELLVLGEPVYEAYEAVSKAVCV